jgi:hypothetical protein
MHETVSLLDSEVYTSSRIPARPTIHFHAVGSKAKTLYDVCVMQKGWLSQETLLDAPHGCISHACSVKLSCSPINKRADFADVFPLAYECRYQANRCIWGRHGRRTCQHSALQGTGAVYNEQIQCMPPPSLDARTYAACGT